MFQMEENDPLIPVYGKDYFLEQWKCKFNLVRNECQRRKFGTGKGKLVEIGVRLGYGAEAIITGCTFSLVDFVGIDAYCDEGNNEYSSRDWFLEAAIQRLDKTGLVSNAEICPVLSSGFSSLPSADIYHIDADHTYAGCLQDILLVCKSAREGSMVIIDDALSNKEVYQTCIAVTRESIGNVGLAQQDGKFFFGGNGNFVFYYNQAF